MPPMPPIGILLNRVADIAAIEVMCTSTRSEIRWNRLSRARGKSGLICPWQSSTGILLHVRVPRAICMPPIYRYWYVYSRSIFRIQNSECAFHFIVLCVFSVDFQKHATFWCMFLKIDWKYTYKGGMLILKIDRKYTYIGWRALHESANSPVFRSVGANF